MAIVGYCLKEKKAPMKCPKEDLNKLGRMIASGTCSSCGGKMYKILKAEEASPALLARAAKAKKGKTGG